MLGALDQQLPITRFGVGVSSDWTPGSRYQALHPQAAGPLSEGVNLEVGPPRRLVQSFNAAGATT